LEFALLGGQPAIGATGTLRVLGGPTIQILMRAALEGQFSDASELTAALEGHACPS
jgi:hypothetical protein